MSRVMRTSIGTVKQLSFEFVEKEERIPKGSYEYRAEHKTRSVRKTGRKTGREESITYDTHSQKQANRHRMCVRETKAIIGKAPRLGIYTLKCRVAVRPCGSFSERNVTGIQEEWTKSVITLRTGITTHWVQGVTHVIKLQTIQILLVSCMSSLFIVNPLRGGLSLESWACSLFLFYVFKFLQFHPLSIKQNNPVRCDIASTGLPACCFFIILTVPLF